MTLPTQARFVAPALAFIRATAASCGFCNLALNDIEIAAEEALTNVITHAFEGDANESFKLSVRITEADFLITVYEKGMPFSPDKVTEFTPEKLQDTLEADGLGVYLMKKMMDEVLFENLGRDGKSLTLVKHIQDSQTRTVVENTGNEALVKGRADIVTGDISYEIRPFRPEDALEISRCAYKAYGYTYEPYVYYPEQIIAMNQLGTLRSFVATGTDNKEIMGHLALKYKNVTDRIAEIGVAFVKPEYRRSGIFIALNQFCHEQAAKLPLYGTFVRAVTSHIGSQKVADTLGYQVCGISLGLFPDDVDFKALTGKIRQKETGLSLYRHISDASVRTIYPPLRHKEKIEEMFRSFEIPVRCAENNAPPDCGESRLKPSVIPALNVADLEISSIGADIVSELKKAIHGFCLQHLDAIFLQICLEDPYSPFVVQQCEQMGCFFSGVLPFAMENRHSIILQYMNNLAINYDMIKPYSKSAVAVLDYVKSCDPGRAV